MKKPTNECCGEEILIEALFYLRFSIKSILPTSKSISCGVRGVVVCGLPSSSTHVIEC
jgi:myosin-crossreactive antigen